MTRGTVRVPVVLPGRVVPRADFWPEIEPSGAGGREGQKTRCPGLRQIVSGFATPMSASATAHPRKGRRSTPTAVLSDRRVNSLSSNHLEAWKMLMLAVVSPLAWLLLE